MSSTHRQTAGEQILEVPVCDTPIVTISPPKPTSPPPCSPRSRGAPRPPPLPLPLRLVPAGFPASPRSGRPPRRPAAGSWARAVRVRGGFRDRSVAGPCAAVWGRPRPVLPAAAEPALPLPICKGCGIPLAPESDQPRRRGTFCPECLALGRREVGGSLSKGSIAHMASVVNETGIRPSHTPRATALRREANQRQQWDQATWEEEHQGEEHDPQWFGSEILPGLAAVPLSRIAKAIEMSVSSASKIRAGRRIPHPRDWEALVILIHEVDG